MSTDWLVAEADETMFGNCKPEDDHDEDRSGLENFCMASEGDEDEQARSFHEDDDVSVDDVATSTVTYETDEPNEPFAAQVGSCIGQRASSNILNPRGSHLRASRKV